MLVSNEPLLRSLEAQLRRVCDLEKLASRLHRTASGGKQGASLEDLVNLCRRHVVRAVLAPFLDLFRHFEAFRAVFQLISRRFQAAAELLGVLTHHSRHTMSLAIPETDLEAQNQAKSPIYRGKSE